MISTVLIVILVLTGIIFVGSVLLMSPKGGLGAGIMGGAAGNHEYGSKKSVEGKLKYIALISGIGFVVIALFLPYILRG